MFGLKKDKKIMITSPIEGEVLPLSMVKDPVFRDKIVGDGVAILPSKGRVVAPADGTVAMLFDTRHAISIRTEQGVELLIHIGLDTVNLKGQFFTAHVSAGDTVKKGDLLVEFDVDGIKGAGYEIMTPVIICNMTDYSGITSDTGGMIKELEQLITVKK
jgi:PTS system beta-glucosides-specific IIC component